MTANVTSLNRRGALRAVGGAALAASVPLAPFRGLGGVAWAASLPKKYRQWVYAKPMEGNKLTAEQFAMREVPIPDLKQGQALVRVKLINVHAATRSRMAGGTTKIGDTDKTSYACAEVLQSRDKTFKEGDTIAMQAGWQDYQVVNTQDESIGYGPANPMVEALNGTKSQWCYAFRPAMVKMWPPEVLMDIFGTSGTTAYFGMRECGPLMPRDAVAVAGTTGAVGSIVGQLAKAAGCYVVGFGGGPDRAKWVTDTLGMNKALDYRAKDLDDQLKAAFPNGIDVYSDGVGGPLTESVAKVMNKNSRLLSYGNAAQLYSDQLAPPRGTSRETRRRFGMTDVVDHIVQDRNIKVEAWIVDSFYQERLRCEDDLSRMLLSGALKSYTSIVDGFDKLPQGVLAHYEDKFFGKVQVRFA